MPLPKLLAVSIACIVSGAALGAQPAPPAWASAGDESGRTADSRTTTAPQQPNATSRGAAAPRPSARSASAQSAESAQDTGPTSSSTAPSARGDQSSAKSAGSSSRAAKTSSATQESGSGGGQSAAAGGSAAKSEQVANTTTESTPADSSNARSSGSRQGTVYTSDDYIQSRGRDWGWLGLLGLFGLLGFLRRPHYQRHTDTVVSRPVDDPARGVRAYETPDPVARPSAS